MASETSPYTSASARLDQPSFFQRWERRTRSATHSDSINNESRFSTDSSHPSPKSSAGPPRVRRMRQTFAERSTSAPAATIPEFAVPKIANLTTRGLSKTAEPSDESSVDKRGHRCSRSGDFLQLRQGSTNRAGAESKKSSVSSVTRHLQSRLRISASDFRIPECRIANSAKDLIPPRKERPGYKWTKASRKDDWVERLISTSGIMQRRARSADLPPAPMKPLRPPASRQISGRGCQYTVKLETSFAQLRPDTPSMEKLQPPRPSIAARTKTILAKRVRFAFNRGSMLNNQHSPSTPLKSSLLSARNRTTEGLHRVASILRFMVSEPTPTNDRAREPATTLAPTSLKHSHRKGTFHLPTVIRTRARKSPNVSYTSSIRRMRRGGTPDNTPDPRETYRVKRSASADTEVFFKIDISVRGGTSYLPSEARRVHTPPLPGGGPGQKRMGFFFDHTAPNSEAGSPVGEGAPLEPAYGGARGKRGKMVGGTDWFETQLMGVDAVDDGGGGGGGGGGGEVGRVHVDLLAKAEEGKGKGKRKGKEVVDLNVPEHLPSSPLCPRNGKHRSGGLGVCWMHGRR